MKICKFLSSDDDIEFSPVVFNKTWKDLDFKLSFSWTNLKVENPNQTIFIKNWDSKTVYFKAKVASVLDEKSLANIDISALSKDSKIFWWNRKIYKNK